MVTVSPSVARNLLAHDTADQVACAVCGQPVGTACVTNASGGGRQNVAQFPHMKRVRARWAEL